MKVTRDKSGRMHVEGGKIRHLRVYVGHERALAAAREQAAS